MRPCRQATTSYSANPRFSRVYANATNTVAMAQFKRWRGVCGIGTRICLGPGKNHLCTACVLPGLGPLGCHSRWNPSHEQSLSKPSLHATDPEPAHAARHLPGVQGRQQHHPSRRSSIASPNCGNCVFTRPGWRISRRRFSHQRDARPHPAAGRYRYHAPARD